MSPEEARLIVYGDDLEEEPHCPRCGGEGWFMAVDADPSDWGEDTYCGPLDAEIKCVDCKGTGYILRPTSTRAERK